MTGTTQRQALNDRDVAGPRSLFPLLGEGRIWLQHAGGAPVNRASRDAVERVARLQHELPGQEWVPRFRDERQRLREAAARLVGAPARNLAFTRGTAHGLSLVARGLPWRRGDNVVSVRGEFPTNLYPWMALEPEGVELRLARPDHGRVTAEAVFDAVDERTRVVTLSLVQFWNGYRLDAARIGAECRRRGIVFVVDAAQAAGAVPIDVQASGIDLLAACAMKWMLGPAGFGICYVASGLLERLTPPLVGVGSVGGIGDPFRPALEWTDSAARFEESALSWYDVAACHAGLELILDVGTAAIDRRLRALTDQLIDGLASHGYEIVEPPARAATEGSGIVSFRRAGLDPEIPARQLADEGITVGTYADFVRFSPHFYNTTADIQRAIDVLAAGS